jgi:RimJ/RimL family protein N-acetyltransferase
MDDFRIETDRLILRAWREEDAATIDDDDPRALVSGQMLNQSLFGHCFWPIERKSDHHLLGYCGLNPRSKASVLSSEIEIGWQLAPPARGHGYAREAAEAVLAWAWSNLDAPRVVAITVAENRPSRGLMERLGMTRRPDLDFDHPQFESGHLLHAHIVYGIERP